MERLAVSVLSAVLLVGGVACGGTTGHETLPTGPVGAPDDATVDAADDGGSADASPADATLGDESIYTGTFDVLIPNADRALPDVQAIPEAGEAAEGAVASGPPNCPPFIPVTVDDGGYHVVPLGQESDQLPSDFAADGSVSFASPDSACATYPWLGSLATDDCVSMGGTSFGGITTPWLPPCNWAEEAGIATQGSGAGTSLRDLCLAYYECAIRTTCFLPADEAPGILPILRCFCGLGVSAQACSLAPNGPCVEPMLAAFNLPDDPVKEAPTVLGEITTPSTSAGALGWVLKQFVVHNGCAATSVYVDASTE